MALARPQYTCALPQTTRLPALNPVHHLRRPVGGHKPGRCGMVVPNGVLFLLCLDRYNRLREPAEEVGAGFPAFLIVNGGEEELLLVVQDNSAEDVVGDGFTFCFSTERGAVVHVVVLRLACRRISIRNFSAAVLAGLVVIVGSVGHDVEIQLREIMVGEPCGLKRREGNLDIRL